MLISKLCTSREWWLALHIHAATIAKSRMLEARCLASDAAARSTLRCQARSWATDARSYYNAWRSAS